MNKILKGLINIATASPLVIAPLATIACSADDASGSSLGYYKTIEHEGVTYRVFDNKVEYDREFGVIDNPYATATTAITENTNRGTRGYPFTFRGYSDELLNYSSSSYADNAFHRSWVELEENQKLTQTKATQSTNGAEFTLLDPTTTSTANSKAAVLSQNDNNGYSLDTWNYLDVLNTWGGSASEGIFLTPSAEWINVAHRNGVPMIGTFFGAPQIYGGQMAEIINVIKQHGGSYKIADKMVELALDLGFDGWFLNFETETGAGHPDYTTHYIPFLQRLKQESDKHGLIIQQYGASGDEVAPAYHNADSASVAGQIGTAENPMLDTWAGDYRFINNASTAATNVKNAYDSLVDKGFTPSEAAAISSYGIEFEQRGFNTAEQIKIAWDASQQDDIGGTVGQMNTSLWSYTFNKEGDKSADARRKYWSSDGDTNDVRQDTISNWSALNNPFTSISNLYRESTVLFEREKFSTSFNRGQGADYYENGQIVDLGLHGPDGWQAMSMQDILPTYRYWTNTKDGANVITSDFTVQTANTIIPHLSEEAAFNGNHVIAFKGAMEADTSFETKLYGSDIPAKAGDKFEVVYQGADAAAAVNLALWEELGESATVTDLHNQAATVIPADSTEVINGWTKATYTMPADMQLAGFGIDVSTTSAIADISNFKLGELTYDPDMTATNAAAPKLGTGTSQGVFVSEFADGAWSKDVHTYRLAFDEIENTDNLKTMKYYVEENGQWVMQSFSGSHGILFQDFDLSNAVTINGTQYLKYKVEFVSYNNEDLGEEYGLIEIANTDVWQ